MRMKRVSAWLASLMLLLFMTPVSAVAGNDLEAFLPPVFCGDGWKMEGKPLFYNRETLSDRIDGEAELYFPYGFDGMSAARYVSEKKAEAGIDVEIYRMGSLRDAFGMYANYRQKDGQSLNAGAEANLAPPQLFFYQGRYFVHIQVTGSDDVNGDALVQCGQATAVRLPGTKNRPPELTVLDRPEVVKGTERYLPQSLLGYDFLNKGIMADAVINGMTLQIFRLLDTTVESATVAFERYRSHVAQGKVSSQGKVMALLEGIDPLYGPIVVLRKGDCLAGALKFNDMKGVLPLVEALCR